MRGVLLVFLAKWFAIFAHTSIGQKRKYTGEPYWHHPREVAKIIKRIGGTPEQIASAWLHDVVEDTWVKPWMIRLLFGKVVSTYVDGLTDVSKPTDGNRAFRKAMDRNHIAMQCPAVKSVKAADLIDNSVSIMEYDPDFSVVFFREIDQTVAVIQEAHRDLLDQLVSIMSTYYNSKLKK